MRGRYALLLVLAVALLVRAALVWSARDIGLEIEDEQHYAALATSLADGHGFAWGPGEPTSIRPPLYPALVAAVWTVTGSRSLEAVRWVQVALALLSVWLVYRIGCLWFTRDAAVAAAAGLALYPALLFSGVLVLTETLFTALLLAFIYACARLERRPTVPAALAAGVALGLAALARSVMWPFVLLVPVLAWFGLRSTARHRAVIAMAAVAGYALVVGPWAARNTSLQGTFAVVDTMGGLNLYMGNYAHSPEDRMWDAVSLTGGQAWSATLPPRAADGGRWTEGTKEKWAQRQAVSYMLGHPATTARRSALKFADFWGLERDFIAGVQRGYYDPPVWLVVAGALAITLSYVATAVLAVVGIFLAPPSRRAQVLLLTVVLFISGVHAIVFGHSRYHLPLVPVLLLFAASALTSGQWRRIFTMSGPAILATATVALLALVWSWEIFVRDWDRIRQLVTG
jgi:4-amino-4-deoxy-L-arabinose transferase-like glycosyltransferase